MRWMIVIVIMSAHYILISQPSCTGQARMIIIAHNIERIESANGLNDLIRSMPVFSYRRVPVFRRDIVTHSLTRAPS